MILASLLLSAAIAGEIPVSTPNVTAAFSSQAQPQIASDGTNFLVAWRDNRHADNYGSIWASRVGPDGRMLDLPTGIPIFSSTYPPPTTGTNAAPAVVWSGSSWLVLWSGSDFSQLQIRRVDRDGSLPDSAPRNIDAGTIVTGAVAAAGGRVLVAYQPRFGGIGARLLDENGAPAGDPIPLQKFAGDLFPVVASNGRSFLMAWWHFDVFPYVALAPVSADGTLGSIRYIPTKSMPVLASSGSDFLLVYADDSGALEAEHLDAQGHTLAQHVLLNKPILPSTGIALAPYGSGYLAAIPASEQTSHPVNGVVLDHDGAPAGTTDITSNGTAEGAVALGTNGTDVLAAWPQGDDLYSRLIGQPASETILSRSATVQRTVVTATDGHAVLAVWHDADGIRAGLVGAGGLGTLVSSNVGSPPVVAFDGVNYVVAWIQVNPGNEIAFVRIAPDGSLIDTTPLTLAHEKAFFLAIASNGRESLFAWTPVSDTGLFALRIDHNGTELDAPQRISSETNFDTSPAIAWNGSTWLVAWNEVVPPVNSCPLCASPPPPPTSDVHAARLTQTMQLLDPVPIIIAGTSGVDESMASVASNGNDFVVAWGEARRATYVIRARHVAANGTLSDVTDLSSGRRPSVAARGAAYFIAWADSGRYFWTPLVDMPFRLPVAPNGDYVDSISLLGTSDGLIAGYHRLDDDPAVGSVPRGFVRALETRSRIHSAGR